MASVKDRLAAFERRSSAAGPAGGPSRLNSSSSIASRISSLDDRPRAMSMVDAGGSMAADLRELERLRAHTGSEDLSGPHRTPPRPSDVPPLRIGSPDSANVLRERNGSGAQAGLKAQDTAAGAGNALGAGNWRISSGESPRTPRMQAQVADAASTYEVSAAFKACELNGDGKLGKHELQSALAQALADGPPSTAEERDARRAAGIAPDAKVDMDGFAALVKHIQELRSSASRPRPKISSKQASSSAVLKVHGAHGGTHSFAEEENAAFSTYISRALAGEPHVQRHLPIDPASLDLFQKVADGVVLCKLVNHAVPETIDDRAVNTHGRLSLFQVTENLNLAISAAKAIGCHIINIDASDIQQGTPHLVLGMVWQIVKIALLSGINLAEHPQLVVLLREGEELAALKKLPPEHVLLRWVNWHLQQAGRKEVVKNFGKDVTDSVAYTVLLSRIAPPEAEATLEPLRDPDTLSRAQSVVRTAARISGVTFSITAHDIVAGNEKLNMAFVAALFNAAPGLDRISAPEAERMLADAEDASECGACAEPPMTLDESREERAFRMWMNSLGIGRFIHNLFDDTKDGVAILQTMDRLKQGIVNWARVPAKARTVYETVETCNYAVDLGRNAPPEQGFGLSLVGIQGKDLADGNRKLILAVIWQLMRFHVLNFIALTVKGAARSAGAARAQGKTLSPGAAAAEAVVAAGGGGEGAAITEEDVLRWANDAVARLGSKRRIESFRDRTLKTGMFLLDVVRSVESRSVDLSLVHTVDYDLIHGADDKLCAQNAKYAISCARKLGCAVFLLWEDIVDVRHKMIFTFIAAVMARQLELGHNAAIAESREELDADADEEDEVEHALEDAEPDSDGDAEGDRALGARPQPPGHDDGGEDWHEAEE